MQQYEFPFNYPEIVSIHPLVCDEIDFPEVGPWCHILGATLLGKGSHHLQISVLDFLLSYSPFLVLPYFWLKLMCCIDQER